MRVLIVDDHSLVREAMRVLLHNEGDIVVVGEAANGRHAVELARRFQPDIILMDVRMPEMDGIEATRLIHADLPRVTIIGLSMFKYDEHGDALRDAGAVAYVMKSAAPTELLDVMRACYAAPGEPRPPRAAA